MKPSRGHLYLVAAVLLVIPTVVPLITAGTAEAQPTTSVSGTITYATNTGGTPETNPVQEAEVYLVDTVKDTGKNPSSCTYVQNACTLELTTTNASGYYSFPSVSTTDNNGHIRKIEVRVYAQSLQGYGVLCTSVNPVGSWCVESPAASPQVAFSDSTAQKAGSALTENVAMTSTSTRSDQSFSVFDIVRMAMEWASMKGAWGTAPNVQGINVTYPATSTATVDYAVDIARDDAFDTDPVLHEIGHVYETMYQFATINPGGNHYWEDDLTATHDWSDGTGMAFNEGFVDDFPEAIRQELPLSDLPNGVSQAPTYTDPGANGTGGFEEPILCGDVTCKTPKGLGEGNELAVARMLDLMHAGFESASPQSLVNMLTSFSGTVNTLSQAVQSYLGSNNLTFAGSSGSQVTTTDAFGEQLASGHRTKGH